MKRFAALAVLLSCSLAFAAVNVGDKPEFSFTSDNTKEQISSESLRGKIVVIDFWATWCGPCMAAVPHMVKLNEEYAAKGVVIIGISLDQSAAAMLPVAQQKGMVWPNYVDTTKKLSGQFGVTGIPNIFILDPTGTVVWRGHPSQIDKPLADALQKTPPQLVDPKTLASATAALEKIEALLAQNAPEKAVKLLTSIPADARKEKSLAEKLTAVEKKFEDYANKSLAEIDDLIGQKQYAAAITRLNDLSRGLGSLPAAATARKKLAELASQPEVKAELEKSKRTTLAAAELAAAKKLQDAKKHEQAYARFKLIATSYADTPSGEEAKSAVAEYEKDPAFVKKATESAIADKANAALSMAEQYANIGKPEEARRRYEEIIKTYPGTSFADKAKAALAKLK